MFVVTILGAYIDRLSRMREEDRCFSHACPHFPDRYGLGEGEHFCTTAYCATRPRQDDRVAAPRFRPAPREAVVEASGGLSGEASSSRAGLRTRSASWQGPREMGSYQRGDFLQVSSSY